MAISTQRLEELSKDRSLEALKILLETIAEKNKVSKEDLLTALKSEQEGIPIDAFSSKLSALEVIVKYLKENQGKKYSEIARFLHRDDRTIWSTYKNSQKKHIAPLSLLGQIIIPVSLFSKRTKSVLEILVIYLKEEKNQSFNEISKLLNKDYQTIYTSYKRGMSR